MKSFRDLAIAAVVTLAVIASLELGLRLAGIKFEASVYEADPLLYKAFRPLAEGWTVKEGDNYFRINSLGMRDRERQRTLPPDTLRLAVIGDSMTAAQAVPLDRTFTQVLERRLSTLAAPIGRHVEVLNFGLGGATLAQMYRMLDQRVWSMSPKVVLMCITNATLLSSRRKLNALGDTPYYLVDNGHIVLDPTTRPPATDPHSLLRHRQFGDLHNRLRLLQLVWAAANADWTSQLLAPFRHPPATSADKAASDPNYRPPATPEVEEAWKVTEAVFAQANADARRHGAEFWLVFIESSILEDPRPGTRRRALRQAGLTSFDYAANRYAQLAAREGFHFLRTGPPMHQRAVASPVPLRGFFNSHPHQGHWNVAGNQAMAEFLESELLSHSAPLHEWLPAAPGHSAPSLVISSNRR